MLLFIPLVVVYIPLVVVYSSCCCLYSSCCCLFFLLFVVVVQLGVVIDLKEKVARSSLSSPSVVRVCVVVMGM